MGFNSAFKGLTTNRKNVSQGRTQEGNIKCTSTVITLWADRHNFNTKYIVEAV